MGIIHSKEQTPGYTTTERTERVLNDILEDDPFRSVNSDSVYERTMQHIAGNRSKTLALQNIFTLDDLALPHLFRSSLNVVKEMNTLPFLILMSLMTTSSFN